MPDRPQVLQLTRVRSGDSMRAPESFELPAVNPIGKPHPAVEQSLISNSVHLSSLSFSSRKLERLTGFIRCQPYCACMSRMRGPHSPVGVTRSAGELKV